MAGGGAPEVSVLETPVLMLAGVMAFFLVVTGGFEWMTHKFRHFLLSRNKLGLLAALDAMMNEILLLGFASLLLLMVQKNVSGLCFAEGDYKLRTWLDSVDGCACCLSRTEGVSGCFLKARGCGSAAAMKACCAPLEGKGRTCDNPSYYEELLSAAGKSAAAAAARALGGGGGGGSGSGGDLASSASAAPHRRLRSLLASGGGALLHGAAAAAETAETDSCAGRAEVGIGGCPPGKRPAVTVTALHEVHVFIFSMALTHIFACVLLIVMASLRVHSWRRWEEGREGAAAAEKEKRSLSLPAPPSAGAADAAAAAAAAALEAGPSSASAADVEAEEGAGVGLSKKRVSFPEEIEGNGTAKAVPAAATAVTATATATAATTTTATTPRRRSVFLQRAAELDGFFPKLGELCICTLRQLLVLFPVTKREYLDMREAWMAAHRLEGGGGGSVNGGKENGSCCCCEKVTTGKKGGGGNGDKCCSCGCAVAVDAAAVSSSLLPPISFADYVMKSFDDDVAGIVGLGTPMWVLLIVFLLLSDRIGWCIWVFLVVAGAMLLALAVKLSWIVRYTSRARVPDEISGNPHDLDPEAFFFRRPWMMLPPIKLLLFFVSLVWSNALFFSANFGRRSCFFSRRGLQSIPVSWWGVVVASVLMFVALAVNVMPAYSICVHLGLDHKPHLLPSDEHREHFRQVAEERKKEREEREREALARAEATSGARARRQRLQKMVSRRLPRQSDLSAAAPSRSVSSEHHH